MATREQVLIIKAATYRNLYLVAATGSIPPLEDIERLDAAVEVLAEALLDGSVSSDEYWGAVCDASYQHDE
jgi:hypothetical protein